MVKVVPLTAAVSPVGKPDTVALVAPPPNVYVIGVMAVLIQSVWFSVDGVEDKDSVWTGFTIIESPPKATAQLLPVVVILQANGDPVVVVGVPDIVKVEPVTEAETPAGRPETFAPVAPPPKVQVIGVMAVLTQTDCPNVLGAELGVKVCPLLMVIVPPSVATAQALPVVVMAYVNVPVTEGEPEIVNVVPDTAEITPVGNPVTVAPVAPEPKVQVIAVIAVLTQTDCVSVATAELSVIV